MRRPIYLLTTLFAAGCAAPAAEVVVPPPLHEEAVAFDVTRQRLVLFGGTRQDSAAPGGYANIADTYEWRSGEWRRTTASAEGPGARTVATMAYDPVRRTVVMLGGAAGPWDGSTPIRQLNDVWIYRGDGWEKTADAPVAYNTRLVTGTDGLLLVGFAGLFNFSPGPSPDPLMRVSIWKSRGDVWEFADSSGPRTTGPPRPAYDATRNALVIPIFDGPDAGVWEWNGSAWRHTRTTTGPVPRTRFLVAFDERSSEVVLFGGNATDGALFNDLWSWTGTRWRHLPSGNAPAPSARYDGTLLWEPRAHRLLLIGGMGDDDRMQRDLWAHTDDGWRQLQ